MDECLTVDQGFGLLPYLRQFWNIYNRERLWLRDINGSQNTPQSISQIENNGDPLPLGRLACKIKKILTSENSVNSIPRNLPKLFKDRFSNSASLNHGDQLKKRAGEIGDILVKLGSRLVANHFVFSVVANDILDCVKTAEDNYRPMTALLLGLTIDGKANLQNDLTKLFDDENSEMADMVFQINLSQCFDYDEFFRLTYVGHNRHGLGCRRVGMRVGSILLIDEVETAPQSVLDGLISLLGSRILTHHDGACTIDLRDTVIFLISDLGNRGFIAEIFKEPFDYWSQDQPSVRTVFGNPRRVHQQEGNHFNFELLSRVDEVVFFNPAVGDQLTSFARLSMILGPHLEDRDLTRAFEKLFDESIYEVDDNYKMWVAGDVRLLSSGFISDED